MRDDIASEVAAIYAIKGPRAELERTVPLEPGELSILGVIAHAANGDSPSALTGSQRSFLRLSTRRLCIARHYALVRDRIIVLPPAAILEVVGQGPSESVLIRYRAESGERAITMVNWREPRQPDRGALSSTQLDDRLRRIATALLPNN